MELTQYVIPLFVALEVALILALYRYVLRDWIIQKWEEKMDEEGWLVIRLDPVINEIEDRMHDKLEQFQSSFFGSIGAMTKRAQNLDPSKNIRKAAKDGDVMSLLVEYALNKSGVGGLAALQSADTDGKEGVNSPKTPENTNYLVDYLNK
tara:strand:+ start:268 stop:717 length:450 start_codon:yes stop_codon:yes gene_type:complete